ncbi:MAG TPA: nitronate monooxygenase, partial [Stellaceae bacterium]|nr:nitronate monooxygenase [Stellaceae bacterium]
MSHGIGAPNFKLGGGRAASPWSPERERVYCELDRLWMRGRDLLGCEIAIMGGAMTWVSERNLVAAISNAGGFGVIASGSMSPELLSLEIGA